MKTIEKIVSDLMADDSVVKFKLRTKKDGLVFIKITDGNNLSKTILETYNSKGQTVVELARTAKEFPNIRYKLAMELKEDGYTQQEIALVYNITQMAAMNLLRNAFKTKKEVTK